MKKKKRMKTFVIIVLCLLVLGAGTVFGVNGYVKSCTSDRIITSEEAAEPAYKVIINNVQKVW